MKIIKRKMEVVSEAKNENNHERCQASLNSDGCITLRNYSTVCRNEDEISILSEKETKAIFALMEVIKDNSTRSLPF